MTDGRAAAFRRSFAFVALTVLAASGCIWRPARTPTRDLHQVDRIIDGDTIALSNGEVVRYLGIDAPELNLEAGNPECYAAESAARNRELVEGGRVRLELDRTDRDAYDRLLRYVFVDGVFVNADLVRGGHAYSHYRPPDTSRYDELLRLELEAEEHARGLWGVCHGHVAP